MIKVKRKKNGEVQTIAKGEPIDVAEQLLNATISIVETLVEQGKLDVDKVEPFMKNFAQQVIDNIKVGE